MEGTNLLGKSHKQYVQDQIKVRQEKLGKTTKDSTDISWSSGKTSWVRMASSVDIKNSTIRIPFIAKEEYENARYDAGGDSTSSQTVSPEINTIIKINLDTLNSEGYNGIDIEVPTGEQRLELLGLDDSFMGSTLAQKLILHGGIEQSILGDDNNSLLKRSGITTKTNQSTASTTSAYSSKNGDFGLVAMPGIQSVDIKSKSMGSLREANISLRVNDAEQLELIETLYLRLGYSMFLEWGNSSYFNNDKEYVKGALAEPGLIYDFLQQETPTQQEIDRILTLRTLDSDGVGETLTPYQIEAFKRQIDSVWVLNDKIEEERKRSCGNYDAFFGKVTNFSWEFDPQGFYNVSLTMISWGDIIESLNINPYFPDVFLDFDDKGEPIVDVIDRKNSSALEAFIYEATLPEGESTKNTFLIASYDTSTTLPTKKTLVREFKQNLSIIFFDIEGNKNSTQTEYSYLLSYDRFYTNSSGKIISGNAIFGEKNHYYYLRFGDLLDFIQEKLLIYNKSTPILTINTTPGKNFCYNPKINVSADPSKVMIRRKLPFSDGAALPIKTLDKIPKDLDYFVVEGIFDGQTTVGEDTISLKLEEFDSKVPGTEIIGGDIMNIYFEKEYLYSEIDKLRDAKSGKLILYKFIKNLLDTANSCLGGVNNLDIRVKDDRVIEIFDQTPLYGIKLNQPEKETQKFNIYGVEGNNGSFISNFGLKTELTNEFATTVAIGAQANGQTVGEDSTMLSKWNFGLIDRFIPEKIDSIVRDQTEKNEEKELKSLTEKIKQLWHQYQIQSFEGPELINKQHVYKFPIMGGENESSNFVKLQQNFFQSLIKLECSNHRLNPNRISNQIGMLPINLNLEMDGISGIRIYDQIHVDTRFLPSYYPNYLIFIVKGISHKFIGNRWVTSVDTIAQPKVQFQQDLQLFDKFQINSKIQYDLPNVVISNSSNPIPNATDLRTVLDELGYQEKGEEIANGGDITFDMKVASEAVFRYIKATYPTIEIVVTGGNDLYHQTLDADYVSLHTTGNAVDFQIFPPTEENIKNVKTVLQEYTAGDILQNFSFIDEYADPSKKATGKHFHMVIGGGPSAISSKALANALADEGKITRRSSIENSFQQGMIGELNRPF